jgi:mRNA-degrading endonuclease RelE of RelBE toxin-antitoxin system
MNFEIILSETFKKEAKKLLKKYPSLKSELLELSNKLQENPFFGTAIGNDIYKIRLSISSKNKGARGGARIISYVKIIESKIYLISIYNKGEKDNISNQEIFIILQKENI